MKSRFILGLFALSSSMLQAETEAFADFFIWCANVCSAENWGQVFTASGSTTNVDLLPVSFGCDYGFRLGFDYLSCHDGWDIKVFYTGYRTVGKDSASTEGEITSAFLGNFYINNADGLNLGPSYRNASIRWKIVFNMFDAEIGRSFCATDCLSLRPFIGLKGGWINQTIDTTWKDPTNPALVFTEAIENLENDFWGIGPSAGLNMDWFLFATQCHRFSLFNDLSGALMFGHWTLKDRYRNDGPEKVTIDFPGINGAATTVRDFVGLAWKREGECVCFTVRIGYEAQVWLGQLKLYTLNVGRLDNVLTLQGGTVDFRIAF